jgi:cbb3-type cytochrome oxidase subunit 3
MSWFDLAGTLRPLALVLMTALFAWLAWRAFAPKRRPTLEHAARIPLADDR